MPLHNKMSLFGAAWGVRLLLLALLAARAVAQPGQPPFDDHQGYPPSGGPPPPGDFGPGQPGEPPPPGGEDLFGGPPRGPGGGEMDRGPGREGRPRFRRPLLGGGNFNGGRLVQVDKQLMRHRAQFEELDRERQKLVEELAKQRGNYDATGLSAGSVLQRREMDRILQQLHRNAERDQMNSDQAARVLRLIVAAGPLWRGQLNNRSTTQTSVLDLRELPDEVRQRWRRAGDALGERNEQDFATALLGPQFGPVVLDYAEQSTEGPTLREMLRAGNQPGGLLRMGEALRGKMVGRIDRLERRVNEMLEETQKQQREIKRLRQVLNGDPASTDPGPGEDEGPGPNTADEGPMDARLQPPGGNVPPPLR